MFIFPLISLTNHLLKNSAGENLVKLLNEMRNGNSSITLDIKKLFKYIGNKAMLVIIPANRKTNIINVAYTEETKNSITFWIITSIIII